MAKRQNYDISDWSRASFLCGIDARGDRGAAAARIDGFLGGITMMDERRDVALAIKSCLDSLMNDAAKCDLDDLARFISLAALAAEEAAMAFDPKATQLKALMAGGAGHC